MAISFLALSYNGGTLTGTEPSGTAQDDVMLALMMAGEHTSHTGPAGWTQLDQVDGTDVERSSTWVIVRGASAPALVWGGPTAANASIEILTYRGCSTTSPTDGHNMAEVLGDSTPDSPSLTTTIDNDWLVCLFTRGFNDPGTITVPSGMVSRFNRPSSDWFAGADLSLGAAGATGAKTWTYTNAGGGSLNSICASVALRPSSAVIVGPTRFRLPSAGTPEVSPATQSYTHTGGVARPLVTSDTSTLTTTAITPDAVDHLVAGDTYFFQGVSQRLAGQVIASGVAIKLAIQCLEAHTNNNLFLQLWIGIYNPAGTSLLATLLAKTIDGTELATTITNRFMNPTTTAGYTCSGGERLVVEISVSGTPTAASGIQGHNASLRFGGSGAGGDNGENDTDTGATLNPWIEFNPGVLFEVPVYGTPFGNRGQNQMQQLLAT
jgi:hypothetical protein